MRNRSVWAFGFGTALAIGGCGGGSEPEPMETDTTATAGYEATAEPAPMQEPVATETPVAEPEPEPPPPAPVPLAERFASAEGTLWRTGAVAAQPAPAEGEEAAPAPMDPNVAPGDEMLTAMSAELPVGTIVRLEKVGGREPVTAIVRINGQSENTRRLLEVSPQVAETLGIRGRAAPRFRVHVLEAPPGAEIAGLNPTAGEGATAQGGQGATGAGAAGGMGTTGAGGMGTAGGATGTGESGTDSRTANRRSRATP